MQRRTFLAASAAALYSLALPAARAAESRKVVVIGAGIIGASIAYHLAKRGASVTVLEKIRPAAGTTEKSFAWLNAFSKKPHPYYEMNHRGIAGWHRVQQELSDGMLPLQWGGCVQWFDDDQSVARVRDAVRQHESWGYPSQMIDPARVPRLLPDVTPGTMRGAAFNDIEGTVNPSVAANALLQGAQRLGAQVEFPVEVEGFELSKSRVTKVRTNGGAIDADSIVIAAGNASPELARPLGLTVALKNSPGLLAHTAPRPIVLERLAFGPGANIKQNPDGSIVTGASFGGTPGVEATREIGESLLRNAQRYLPALAGVPLDNITLGYRVMPADGYPIIGASKTVPNAYVAAMHSGMTLAPLVGELVAMEVLDGIRVDLLETFRPDRFA
ncbi:NAD(P)/FAD-dependent oxidoreductase [Solimonas marina]|uniref:FAD-binding oxidoreductase n=1 Tax=Solimonas marina TaxID=2714601 RepID=A0A970B742_9GAMM|nr:FAD-binding oxidoreductase [Solimonas marina]NKF23483.1 FAD-binding oxidoreductase [Solimonas marina]